jgi:hypothetical protein
MPTLQHTDLGISEYYLFPTYSTREAYKRATGEDAPPFDTARKRKHWYDPQARDSAKRQFVYDRVLAFDGRNPARDETGRPFAEMLVLSRQEAATVNIPLSEKDELPVPGGDYPETPVPLRALADGEELVFDRLGWVRVRNKAIYEQTYEGFSPRDRVILYAMARSLNVNPDKP